MYASSRTTMPLNFEQSPRTSSMGSRFPVGLLGEQEKMSFAPAETVPRDERSSWKEPVRGHGRISTPAVSAATLYMPYVGSTIMTASFGSTNTRMRRSIASSEPFPTNTCAGSTPTYAAMAFRSSADFGYGKRGMS